MNDPDQPLPPDSAIDVFDSLEGRTYAWPESRHDLMHRFFAVALLTVWLAGWAFGWVMVATKLMNGPADSFIVMWFIFWTLAGGLTLRVWWLLTFAARRPESITLATRMFIYDPGTVPRNELVIARYGRLQFGLDELRLIFPRKPVQIPKEDLTSVILEPSRKRTRLSLDAGGEPYEIARYVSDEDRQWLADVLKSWLQSEPRESGQV